MEPKIDIFLIIWCTVFPLVLFFGGIEIGRIQSRSTLRLLANEIAKANRRYVEYGECKIHLSSAQVNTDSTDKSRYNDKPDPISFMPPIR